MNGYHGTVTVSPTIVRSTDAVDAQDRADHDGDAEDDKPKNAIENGSGAVR